MGQFSVEKPVAPGSALSGNQQLSAKPSGNTRFLRFGDRLGAAASTTGKHSVSTATSGDGSRSACRSRPSPNDAIDQHGEEYDQTFHAKLVEGPDIDKGETVETLNSKCHPLVNSTYYFS